MAKIQGSSAIAAVNFGENNAVEVQFQGNDKLMVLLQRIHHNFAMTYSQLSKEMSL